jgi:hypothetical protein
MMDMAALYVIKIFIRETAKLGVIEERALALVGEPHDKIESGIAAFCEELSTCFVEQKLSTTEFWLTSVWSLRIWPATGFDMGEIDFRIESLGGKPEAPDLADQLPSVQERAAQPGRRSLAARLSSPDNRGRNAGSKLEIVRDCGHLSTMQRPDAGTEALRTWIDL